MNDDDDVGHEGYDSDEGAKYNNYDSQPSNFYAQTHLNRYPSFCESDTDFTYGDAVEASMVPEDMHEKVSLNLDQKIPERSTKSHGLFVKEGDINSEEYHDFKGVTHSTWKMAKIDLDAEDAERFAGYEETGLVQIQYMMLIYYFSGEDPRDQFDYDLFLKRYPGWPKAWEHRYGPNGIFKLQSDCSDEVDYSKESRVKKLSRKD